MKMNDKKNCKEWKVKWKRKKGEMKTNEGRIKRMKMNGRKNENESKVEWKIKKGIMKINERGN